MSIRDTGGFEGPSQNTIHTDVSLCSNWQTVTGIVEFYQLGTSKPLSPYGLFTVVFEFGRPSLFFVMKQQLSK